MTMIEWRPPSRRRGRLPAVLSLLAVLLPPTVPGGAATPETPPDVPHRVISLNLCTDQLTMLLLPRERVAALSHLAVDPDLSAVADQVGDLPLVRGEAEDVLRLRPDLVLAGSYTARAAVRLLKAHHVPVLQVDLVRDVEGIRAELRQVAAATGQGARGEALIAAMDRRLAAVTADTARDPRRPSALVLAPGGFAAGAGTLTAAVMAAAGLRDYAADHGLTGFGYLTVESIAADPPDLFIIQPDGSGPPSLAGTLLTHPALLRALPPERRFTVPARLWECGGPTVADAVEMLAAARHDWLARHPPTDPARRD